jgi:dihydrofolate reductase
MRKIILTEFLSLDGVMEHPHLWHFPYFGEDAGAYKGEELFACDAMLLGRVTYEGFAAAWPQRSEGEPIEGTDAIDDEKVFADRMNGMTKYVVSTTLKDLTWNNSHLISDNVPEEVRKLKDQPGQDILLMGSADLADTLRQHNLIDEYRLMVHPIVVGQGKRLFRDGSDTTTLKLVDSRTFSHGVMLHTYAPADPPRGT